MNKQTARYYNEYRIKGWRALNALQNAKTKTEFEALQPNVRIQIIPDEYADYDNLVGDVFNPDVNTNISRSQLAAQEKEYQEKINRDGVWGIAGEFLSCEKCGTYEQADCCFGFVGDEWKDSGIDIDIMQSAIDAYKKHKGV